MRYVGKAVSKKKLRAKLIRKGLEGPRVNTTQTTEGRAVDQSDVAYKMEGGKYILASERGCGPTQRNQHKERKNPLTLLHYSSMRLREGSEAFTEARFDGETILRGLRRVEERKCEMGQT